jgi:cytochrome b
MTANTLSPSAPSAGQVRGSRRVVDATTRMLHWLMALSFTGAYLTADGERWRLVHVTLGYTLAGLLVCRLLWGLFGPRQVRLAVLLRKLQGLPGWLKSLGTLQPAWRQGQNLMMALVVTLILGLVLPLTLSGYAVWDEWGGEWLANVHDFFGNALLAVVLAHIGLIAFLSLLRRKNQAMPMLTGRAAGAGPDLAKRNHGILAVLLLACVTGFWGWQWNEAPQDGVVRDSPQIDNHRNNDRH